MAYKENTPDLTMLALAAYDAIRRDVEEGKVPPARKTKQPDRASGEAGTPPSCRLVIL